MIGIPAEEVGGIHAAFFVEYLQGEVFRQTEYKLSWGYLAELAPRYPQRLRWQLTDTVEDLHAGVVSNADQFQDHGAFVPVTTIQTLTRPVRSTNR